MLRRLPGAPIRAALVSLLLLAAPAGSSRLLRAMNAAPAERIRGLEALAKANDWQQVVSAARQWMRDEPEQSLAYYWLGIALWQQDLRVESIQALRKAELRGLRTAQLHVTLGRAYFAIHQFTLFRQQMAKAAELDPRDPKPHFHLGRYFDSIVGDHQQALGHYRKAAALAPQDGEILYYVGFCQEMIGQREAATATYESSWQLLRAQAAPFGWPCQRLAQLLLYQDAASAAQWARQAVSAQPDVAVNHYVLAKAYLQMNQTRQAVDELREAVRLDPKDPSARYLLATAYSELGQLDEARQARLAFQRLRAAYGSQ